MPIYEYQCAECGHEFDELQRLSDAALKDCPECEMAALVKLVSAPSFRLKGSGWYETDFKQDNRRNLADDASGSGDGPAAKKGDSDSSSATKPAEGASAAKKEAPKTSQSTAKTSKESTSTGKSAKKKAKVSKG